MKVIDLGTWNRTEYFRFFSGMDYPQYNLCFNMDITRFIRKLKEKGLPFYYGMVYAATHAVNQVEMFRYRVRDGQVILHDQIHPSFTDQTGNTKYFKLVTVDLEPELEAFARKAKAVSEAQDTFYVENSEARDDLIYITSIPWISFTHLSHTIRLGGSESVPRISWGKYFREGEKVLLPYSVQASHAFVDGEHVGEYMEALQNFMDNYSGSNQN